MHIYGRSISDILYKSDGSVANQNAQPAIGDYFVSTEVDYSGTATYHAVKPTGADNLACAIVSKWTPPVTVSFWVGGALLLANHFTVDIDCNIALPISGGTQQYREVKGNVASADVKGGTELTLTLAKL